MELNILTVCYLIASVTFILGLKMLSNPASARRGNLIAAGGMTIAIFGTIFLYRDETGSRLHNYVWIFAGIIIGTVMGTLMAKKVKMTAMPEMVSLFNGMGGACAALISAAEFYHIYKANEGASSTPFSEFAPAGYFITIAAGAIIGTVSYTGVAAACGGFLYDNKVMLTGGILVGAAGTLLTMLMCKAMNRSLANVLIGSFGGGGAAAASGVKKEQGAYKEITLSDTAVLMTYANRVIIVPGYGLAVAQAQYACHDLEKILTDKGVDVKYAIHPVAGRMPGHMNVLLAEADVSYDLLKEMEEANEEFPSTDVVLVLGANDVVNPAAKTDPASPIYGMPILDVELAKNVIVNKRSMKPGYAGIENDLFFQKKTSMLFGDAKKVLQDLIGEIKNL